jgi:hypothetical protein
MKKTVLSLIVVLLFTLAPVLHPQVGATSLASAGPDRFIVIDIAFDGNAFFVNSANPAATGGAPGDTFLLKGKLFVGGTIAPGNNTFSPNAPGSIGNFLCRGTMLFSDAEIAAGAAPFVATTQTYLFDNGNMLITEGLEAGVQTIDRAVVGGLGDFSGASGEVHLELLGFNTTGFENYRGTFKLKKKSLQP